MSFNRDITMIHFIDACSASQDRLRMRSTTISDDSPASETAEPGSVSVVVVNWNGEADLEECLSALARQSYSGPIEVTLVDNGSTDASVAVARRHPVQPRLICNSANEGFAKGCNQGIRATESDSSMAG